ncbi:hypothetical protein M513_09897 [Trichuris suis]|uniref:Uncharacterized protein n=1 Tax=Trichuris suis TaxID=68888 RepID=A0A085LWA0_9BILA|nr:hypothetical protein M513_09897 [Trichuris suis]
MRWKAVHQDSDGRPATVENTYFPPDRSSSIRVFFCESVDLPVSNRVAARGLCLNALSTFSRVPEDLNKKYEEYKKSLLKQEKDFLSVNSYVSDECESTTCSLQTVLLKEALKTYGRSKKQLSIDYQDCMLPCIRRQKPRAPMEKTSSESSSVSSSESD